MASHLTIHICETRHHRFLGRQYKRARNRLTYKNRHGKEINLVGHREMLVKGHWFHQDQFYKMVEAEPRTMGAEDIRNRWTRERGHFMDTYRMKRLEVGSNNDSSGYVKAVAELFEGKTLVMLNDELIGKIEAIFKKVDGGCEYNIAEFKNMTDFLKLHKGRRIFTINC